VNTEQLSQKVFGRPWFHRIDLGGGIVTPGVDNSPSKLQYMHLPEDLTGKPGALWQQISTAGNPRGWETGKVSRSPTMLSVHG
jgi:hypothetical protein